MSGELHISLDVHAGRIAPRLIAPEDLPIGRLLQGRSSVEAAHTLPHIFSLCPNAQRLAAQMTLSLPPETRTRPALAREIRRDHLLRLFVFWPAQLGLTSRPLPADVHLGTALAGPSGRLPTPSEFDLWLERGAGTAPLFARLAETFAPGQAVANLPLPRDPLHETAVENSTAARQCHAPLMKMAEARYGRGPLWRALARLVELFACLNGSLPAQPRLSNGIAVVPAARGAYAMSARVENGRVVAFARRTPTNHLLAPGGALEQALASLPAHKAQFARLVVDIMDPCVPVRLQDQEAGNA
ncbi:hypothetical protein C8N32_108123 [Rhodovulum imhoffii]|uniref:Hydrogenase expression/formation protein HupK n=1 Tax=Rhodovulum imhoffii TaxID=365340 RepID=A0A2T5BSE5_9RHOB|nr:hypothetical protein [Rhodovulum imhoffii]MBK5934747.1 hypothetical protein [Rhodovulum imhoffii]PTN02171.1 hypothetical protein C8N32_108123 [Rhodovulum imhoffii]